MNLILRDYLKKLESQGQKNDSEVSDYDSKYLNLERDAAAFICLLIKIKQPKNFLEIGTSNGYSTIWFASALNDAANILTVEKSKRKIVEARTNFERVHLSHKIEIVESDAAEFMRNNRTKYDVIFLDANRKEYMNYIGSIESSLSDRGLIICDNAISHREELSDFTEYMIHSDHYDTITVPVGKGVLVAAHNGG